MYVVTFYSFKGGVGRSMALANVGYQLAQAGRTVLLVDFDLEAPGLPTFNLQRPARLPGGIVDYIHDYLESGEAPSVAEYLYPSESFENGGAIWVMPAGGSEDDYSQKFQSIDWQNLYENREGFLLLEELKEQWRTTIQPDYVLIDSRTGHTDIAGICTRQLPDAVCVLFFPNDQNLLGLRRIVSDIRAEKRDRSHEGSRSIALHFVVSNVPTLDDEEKIVANRLKVFREQLGYKKLSAQIHHYDSLALVNQLVFSRERPNSYLAQEYKTLADAIRSENLEDRDTVLEALRRLAPSPRGNGRAPPAEVSDAQLKSIAASFAEDGEVSFWLGIAWRTSGDPETALLLFNRAIENGYTARDVYFERGVVNRGLLRTAEAINDFWRVLELEDSAVVAPQVILAVRGLLDMAESDILRIADSWSVRALLPRDCLRLADRIDDSLLGLKLTRIVETRLLEVASLDSSTAEGIAHSLGLSLIGLGEFEEAQMRLNPKKISNAELSQAIAFNVAMAKWGAHRTIDRDLFSRVLELDDHQKPPTRQSANYFQCLAIARWATGQGEAALKDVARAKKITDEQVTRDFSAWRYLKVGPNEFIKDLTELSELIRGSPIEPRFMAL